MMSMSISILLNTILNEYFQNSRCLLQISRSPNDVVIKNFPTTIYNSDDSLENLRYKEEERCEDFLLIGDSPIQLFVNLEEFIKKRSEARYTDRRYIIFLSGYVNEPSFNTTAINYVANVLIIQCYGGGVGIKISKFITQDDYSVCDMFTHYYIGEEEDWNKLYLLDNWDVDKERFRNGNNLFPDKISDQFGRNLRIGGADYVPYCVQETHRGLELSFAFEFARRLNMTPVMASTKDDVWGQIYENWTGVGILGNLVMDKHDLSLGALFALPYRLKYSDFSQVTAFSRVTCLVPKPRAVEGWLTPITLFAVNIWCAFAMTYVVIIIVDYIFKLFTFSGTFRERHEMAIHGTIFNVFTTFIMQGQPEFTIPTETYRRILHLINLLLSLIFGVLYSTRLSSSMIVPTLENDINTPRDLAYSKILWGELWPDWVFPLELDNRSEVAVRLTKKFRQETEEVLRSYSLKKNFAFGVERLPSGYFAIGPYMKDDVIHNFKVMKEDIYRQYTSLQLRKNSILLNIINKYILLSSQSGLLIYWDSEATIHHSNMNIQRGIIYPYSEPTLIRLTFAHVKGSFAILFVGLGLSTLAFICERLHIFRCIL